MADSISVDMNEVRTLAVDMTKVDSRLTRHLTPVVKRGAQNIRDDHAAKVRESSWFRFAGQVSYDITDGGYGAEIGPRAEGAGRLENIAYFGGSNGGGGTVEDPQAAADRELPNFEKALAEVAEGLVFG
ncbi:MAG: hypothetical protein ACTHXF_08975 [Brevibacterium yomogidense]